MSTPYYPGDEYANEPEYQPQQFSTYEQQPYPSAPSRRVNKRAIGAMVVFVIAIVILAITMLLPWYNLHADVDGEMRTSSGYSSVSADVKITLDTEMLLSESEMKMDMEATSMGDSFSESQSQTNEYRDDSEIKSAMDITLYLTIISIIFTIMAIVASGITAFGVISNKIGLGIGVICMIFVLITMVYFPIGVPGAMKDDYDESRSDEEIERMGLTYDGSFLGSSSTTLDMSDLPDFPSDIDEAPMDVKWSWGPSYGWYLIVVAFIFAMIGLILIATARVRVPSRYLSQDQRFQAPAREPSYGYNYGPEQYPQPGPAAPLQPERQYKDQRDNYYDQTQRSDYYENQQQNYRHRDQYY